MERPPALAVASTFTVPPVPTSVPLPPTRERLRDQALELIANDGIGALTVRTLCRAVGIRESSFYAHFPSKDALLDELLEQAGAEAPMRVAQQLGARQLPLHEYVSRLVAELTALWTEPQGRKLRVLLEAEVSRAPERRERFNQRVLEMIEAVGRELQRHVDTGALAAIGPADVMAWALVAPVAAMRFSLFAHGASPEHLARGRALAAAHAETWVRAHATGSTRGGVAP